jgi:hypothetical protein
MVDLRVAQMACWKVVLMVGRRVDELAVHWVVK